MNRLIKILKQPHPGYGNLRIYFRTVLGISFVVFLIVSILQPFNIGDRNIGNNPYLTAAVYAGAAALVMSINAVWFLVFPAWFRPEKWVLGKELVVLMYQFCCVALAIWSINYFRGALTAGGAGFLKSLFLAIAIGILPYVIATFGRHNYLLRHHLKEVKTLNERINTTISYEEGTGEHTREAGPELLNTPKLNETIPVEHFLFAESKGNTLLIQTIKKGRLQVYTLRSTLNDFANGNGHIAQLFRCHRSFVINLDKVMQVQGNAAGYQVLLHTDLPPVVVARSNVEAFKQLLVNKTCRVLPL